MSMLNELGISEIGDNLRGNTSRTNMTHKNFDISCGCPMADKILNNNSNVNSIDKNSKNNKNEIPAIDHVRIIHSYIDKEILIPSFEP